MGIHTASYLEAIEHLPDGATLVLHQCTWEDYERLLEDLQERPHLRVSYDSGTLEILSPLPRPWPWTSEMRFRTNVSRSMPALTHPRMAISCPSNDSSDGPCAAASPLAAVLTPTATKNHFISVPPLQVQRVPLFCIKAATFS